ARRKVGLKALQELRGRAVSLSARTSGTRVDARIVLSLARIDEKSGVKVPYLSPDIAAAKVIAGGLDAFFAVAGFPSQNDSRVVLSGHAEGLPIDCPAVDIALLEWGFLSRGKIPAGTHNNEAEIATLNVSALMVVSERLPVDIVYTITQ
ncbi:MAG: TAXI family TRAP transporter solute-binding subunit, partial [Pseudomonadota bacterium]|nr:TAXI family TRAP transporter solute-binding subunit [Pseudomonadota bacterium]